MAAAAADAEAEGTPWPRAGVVLLLGAPGVGKSLLAAALKEAHRSSVVATLNTGQELRDRGLLDEFAAHPTKERRTQIRAQAVHLLAEQCKALQAAVAVESAAASAQCTSKVLLLEFGKDLEDAFTLMEVLREHSLPLLQVLYISAAAVPTDQLASLLLPGSTPATRNARDRARSIAERQAKWAANGAALLEFYSALGVLVELSMPQSMSGYELQRLTAPPRPTAATVPAMRNAGSKRAQRRWAEQREWAAKRAQQDAEARAAQLSQLQQKLLEPQAGTLAALGYAPTGTDAGGTAATNEAAAGGGVCAAGARLWLEEARWCAGAAGQLQGIASGLLGARWVEPLVSSRLVTNRAERVAVLQQAAASTGIKGLERSIAVPSRSVVTPADARWLAPPGRYSVSRKCDGTRHLLLATADGRVYLLNRTGSMYSYPMHTSAASSRPPLSVAPTSTSVLPAAHSLNPPCQEPSSTASPRLPPGTVLDGELMWLPGSSAHRTGVFVAFDALAIGQQPTWQLPLDGRLACLQQLGLQDAERFTLTPSTIPASSTAHASATSNPTLTVMPPPPAPPASTRPHTRSSWLSTCGVTRPPPPCSTPPIPQALVKKQQAPPPGHDTLTLLFKQHHDVTPEALILLEACRPACPYPTDGLVFTPKAPPYTLGMAELLMKWQPPAQWAADISGSDLQSHALGLGSKQQHAVKFISRLPAALVYECLPQQPPDLLPATAAAAAEVAAAVGLSQIDSIGQMLEALRLQERRHQQQQRQLQLWTPHSVRWDKKAGNAPAAVQEMTRRLLSGSWVSHQQLVECVQEVQYCATLPALVPSSSSSNSVPNSAPIPITSPPPTISNACTSSAMPSSSNSSSDTIATPLSTASPAAAAAKPSTPDTLPPPNTPQPSTLPSSPAPPTAALPCLAPARHPARQVPFERLYASVMKQVALGAVERTTDPTTGLEVFCYNMSLGKPRCLAAAMCRGLVLHPPTSSVVATPFVRFGKPRRQHGGRLPGGQVGAGRNDNADDGDGGSIGKAVLNPHFGTSSERVKGAPAAQQSRAKAAVRKAGTDRRGGPADIGWLLGGKEDVKNRQVYAGWDWGGPPACASVKVDGSLVIAFLWEGQLQVATRRRMDSEQALWAAAWMQEHTNVDCLQPGWTYLFEALCPNDVHGVQYNFEGLVLLAAVAPDGHELHAGSPALGQLALQLRVMVVPCLEGPWDELHNHLAAGGQDMGGSAAALHLETSDAGCTWEQKLLEQELRTQEAGTRPQAQARPHSLPSSEGWVLQAPDGTRSKLVSSQYTQARAAVVNLHPLTVWDSVQCGGLSHAQAVARVPLQFQEDAMGILDALDGGFCFVQQELRAQLGGAQELHWAWGGRVLELLEDLAGELVEDRAGKLQQVVGMLAELGLQDDNSSGACAPDTVAGSAGGRAAPGVLVAEPAVPSAAATAAAGGALELHVPAGSCAALPSCISSTGGRAAVSEGKRKAELYRSAAFHAALRYVLRYSSAEVASMYFDPASIQKQSQRLLSGACSYLPVPLLRGLILDCIRPSQDGALQGYAPSSAVAQTHAKGWKRGPADARMARLTSARPTDTSVLSDDVVVGWVLQLGGRSLVQAQLVCKLWRQLLMQDRRYAARVEQAQEEAALLSVLRQATFRDSDDDDYLDYDDRDRYYDLGYDYEEWERYEYDDFTRGYRSP